MRTTATGADHQIAHAGNGFAVDGHATVGGNHRAAMIGSVAQYDEFSLRHDIYQI
jgi:hypothetical protein